MEIVRTLLEQQPMVALFLTIAFGYLVGEINIKGFSLGIGAVLFVALPVVSARYCQYSSKVASLRAFGRMRRAEQ